MSGSIAMLSSCAAHAPPRVERVAARALRCPASEIEIAWNRSTPTTSEWLAGCNFTYVRVHCTQTECHPARPRPPCVGELPCFEEDPVTLDWNLKHASR